MRGNNVKILILRTNGNIVNINTYNMQELGLAKAFIRAGHVCEVAYYGGNEPTHTEIVSDSGIQVKVWWLKGYSIALNGIFIGLNKLIRNYDIVQVSDYDQITSYLLYAISKGRNRVVLYHGPYLSDYNKKYLLKSRIVDLFPKPKKVLTTLPCFTKSVLAENFLRERGFCNVKTVGVGLDKTRFQMVKEKSDEIKNILLQIGNRQVVLYIGRIEERRNTLFLIETFNKVREINHNVCLLLVGDGTEEYKEECSKRINELGLKEFVVYIKKLPQNQLPYLYKQATVFTLPTSYEIFGMVLMEAMLYGVTVITTYNGGSITLIDDGRNGIIRELSEDVWAQEILTILNQDQRRRSIGEEAKKTIEEKCSWDIIAKKMLMSYSKILQNDQTKDDI